MLPLEIYYALVVLAKWIVSQLELMGEMCVSRSVNCMDAVKNEYHYDLIVTGMLDQRYPNEVRA